MPATPAVPWRRIVLPAEHGGWAFLGEPILLGLLVAPSVAGGLIAFGAAAGFLARQPLRLWLGDRRRGHRYARTAQAERAFAVLALVAAAALAGAVVLASGPVSAAPGAAPTGRNPLLLVLDVAGLAAAVALAMDLGPKPREAWAEVLAAVALGSVAAAIAAAAGRPLAIAFGLWAVLACRAAPAVLYVRARLRLDRGEPAGVAGAMLAHAAALAAVAALALTLVVPTLAVAAVGLLVARAAFGLSPWRPRIRTVWLGISEIAFGLVTVLAVARGMR